MNKYCDILKEYKKNGYINFVSVHWGTEYQSIHNRFQENIAHKLIDC
jgi:poly-gamma-glutamate capsule biosynthesis protein CapA/YwtB (metallophosphatase superfamily)